MLTMLLLVACDPQVDEAEPGDSADRVDTADAGDTADTADTAETGDTAGADCAGAECLYSPGRSYEPGAVDVIETIYYTDILGDERAVPIAVYRPADAPKPMPVVVLSHGGAGGKSDPLNSMEHWAPIFAQAGYVAVAVAHAGRDDANYEEVCAALGVDPDIPCGIKIGWDRPHDVRAALDWLDATAAEQPGALDLDHVFLIGHSAGAGGALMIAGATRNYRCALPIGFEDPDQDCQEADLVSLADDRVRAVVAMSPQGPDNDGFMDSSFDTVDRPVLIGTGLADGEEAIGEPANRRLVFPLLPAGEKYELFVDDRGATHTLFEGDVSACEGIDDADRCAEMERWIQTTAVAFFDAQLGLAGATAWLATDSIEIASGGDAEWQRK